MERQRKSFQYTRFWLRLHVQRSPDRTRLDEAVPEEKQGRKTCQFSAHFVKSGMIRGFSLSDEQYPLLKNAFSCYNQKIMPAQKPTLIFLVEHSRLLRRGQREALLKALPGMTPAKQAELAALLAGEAAVLQKAAEFSIRSAAERNDKQFFADLDAFFAKAGATLSKAEEPFEKTDESQQLDHFFDAA